MTPEQEEDWNQTLWKSTELPYPLNYMRFHNPGAAYVITKVLLKLDCKTSRR